MKKPAIGSQGLEFLIIGKANGFSTGKLDAFGFDSLAGTKGTYC